MRTAPFLAFLLVLAPAAAQELVPLPEPALPRMEERVRRQLGEIEARIEASAADPDAHREELLRGYPQLGRLALAYDLMELAAACWRNAAVLEPSNYRWTYLAGFVDQVEGRYADASAAFERAARIAEAAGEPYAPIYLRWAQAELELGRAAAAKPLFERVLNVAKLRAAARYGLGQIAADEEDFAAAVEHFEAALVEQPEALAVHHPLGIAYRQLDDLDKARAHLGRTGAGEVTFADPVALTSAADASGAGYHHTLGIEASLAGDRGRAVAELRKALAIDPDLVGTRLSLARELAGLGRHAAAAAEYEEVVRRAPEDVMARYELGRLLVEAGALAEAERHFRAALRLAPESREACFGLALVLFRTGRAGEAAAALGEYVERYPYDREARRRWATVLAEAGGLEAAAGELSRLVEIDPGDRSLRYQRAAVYAAFGRIEASAADLEHLLVEPGRGGPPGGRDVLEALLSLLAGGDPAAVVERLRGLEGRLRDPGLKERVRAVIDASPRVGR